MLSCNVEIRINLVLCAPVSKYAKLRKLSFSLFSCFRRIQHKSQSLPMEFGSDSDCFVHVSEMPMITKKSILVCSSDCRSQMPHNCYEKVKVVRALRNSEGNVLSIGRTSSRRSLPDDKCKTPGYGHAASQAERSNLEYGILSSQETENQPNCFPKTLRLQKKSPSSDNSQMTGMGNHQENQLALSIRGTKSIETCTSANDSGVFNSNSCSDFIIDDG